MVVEITQIGIQNLHWKFYVSWTSTVAEMIATTDTRQIIWTVLNLSFVPIVYFFYVETAGRTLEDIDSYFRDHHNVIVFRDKVSIHSLLPKSVAVGEQLMLTPTSLRHLRSGRWSTSRRKSKKSAVRVRSTPELEASRPPIDVTA